MEKFVYFFTSSFKLHFFLSTKKTKKQKSFNLNKDNCFFFNFWIFEFSE